MLVNWCRFGACRFVEIPENERSTNGRVGKTRGLVPSPLITERGYATTTEVRSGETVLLSGLQVVGSSRYKEKIPVLGSIPLLGRLFCREEQDVHRRDLLLLVKAEIVKE
jgi:type II secretory pathway component GspD/PulD (secretin)